MNLSKEYQSLRKCLSGLFRLRLWKGIGAFVLILYFITLFLRHFSVHYAINSTKTMNITKTPSINSKRGVACRIPILEPFSATVKKHLSSIVPDTMKMGHCLRMYPILFESTLDGNISPVRRAKFDSLGFKSCCYKTIRRGNGTWADSIEMSAVCHPLSLQNATRVPEEFIEIMCDKDGKEKETVDFHSFIHVKPEVEKRLNKVEGGKRKVNVVIFGIDSYSRVNFHRFMPNSRSYLVDKLDAIEMTGYNKVGLNTYPCIIPLLTNLYVGEAMSSCVKKKTRFYYDDCPLIWKSYAEKGYRTSYAEDYADGALFGGGNWLKAYGGGHDFFNSPTDYDLRPYSVAVERSKFDLMCYGPRLTFQVLLDHLKKLMFQMEKIGKPYFHFTWATILTHGHFTTGRLGDRHLLQMLKWMKNSGILKQTVFILMGDHGNLGQFRNTVQGQLEDRLPLLSLVLPDWMKKGKYSRAFKNLLGNRKRLMTVFDLHQVLLDILNLEGIENDNIAKKEIELSNTEDKAMPRGISLFLPIPNQRTCEMAKIPLEFCACKYLRQLPANSSNATMAATIAVEKINSILNSSNANCSTLSLSTVIMAGYDSERGSYEVNFQTTPGNATFEALVGANRSSNGTTWEATGTISRTNLYGNQSYCVHDRFLKSYCYCA